MPKKQVRNALYFYMKELEPILRREGRVFPNGLADVVPIAAPRYKNLDDREKARYEAMAKEHKAKMRGAEGDKYRMDNSGNIIAHRVDEAAEEEKRRSKQLQAFRENWPMGKALADEKFYIINFQTMCETTEGEFLPAEMAIIEYSIKHGITKKYHTFIEPGKIPTGYRFACKEKSENEHNIPVQGFDKVEHSNYRGMYIQLENFINPNGEKPEYPPMFCMGNHIRETEYCLRWVHGGSCVGYPNRLKKVYELEGLVMDLFGHIGQRPSKSSCIDMLTSSIWDYTPETKCDFHEEIECKYCALGIVQRYAFAISDSICTLYDVKLSKRHLPIRNDLDAGCTILPPTSFKVESRGPGFSSSRVGSGFRRPPPQNQALPPKHHPRQPVKKIPSDDESDDDDDSDDDDKLRKPNTTSMMAGHNPAPMMSGHPGTASMPSAWGVSGAAPRPQPAAIGSVLNPNSEFPTPKPSYGRGYTPALGDFPGLGRGMTTMNYGMAGIGRGVPVKPIVSEADEAPKKFAGRAGAPAAVVAPAPPPAWQAAINDSNTTAPPGLSHPTSGMSQGPRPLYPAHKPVAPAMVPPQQTQNIQSPPPGLLATQNGGLVPSSPQTASNIVNIIRSRGRGILGQNPTDMPVPKGRGYAPPGMARELIYNQQGMQGLSINH